MKKILGGAILGVVLCLGVEYLFLTRGGMPVATKAPPLPFERKMAHAALRHAIGTEEEKPSPIPADEANLVSGARVYSVQCAVCHGVLGHPASAIAKGMFPAPPQLLPPKKGVTDDSVGETYWKVANGIRLTGMPGYAGNLTDSEMWQVSLLLLHAHELPPAALDILKK